MNLNRYKSFSFLLGIFLLCFQNLLAQSWQWSKLGKYATQLQGFSKIATDPNGNIYTIYSAASIDVPGHFRPGYSSGNLCIVSYDCQGNYRWSKMIENGVAMEIGTDNLGGVYFTGATVADTKSVKVDEDTVIGITKKNHIIGKYDTSGNFKWLRMPEPDSLRTVGYDYTAVNISVGANGGLRILTNLVANKFCDGKYTVTDTIVTPHILGYDANGNFTTGFRPDAAGVRFSKMQWDGIRNNYFIIGNSYTKGRVGTAMIENRGLLLCKYDQLGKNEWVKFGTSPYNSTYNIHFEGLKTDNDGAVYVAGTAIAGEIFDGYTFVNDSGKGLTSGIFKYDTDGNRIWAVNSKEGGGEGLVFALSKNTIAAYGPMYKSTFIRWAPGYEVGRSFKKSIFAMDSFNVGNFFVRIDVNTGEIKGLDSVSGARLTVANGYGDICANQNDGFYIVGTMNGYKKGMIVPSLDTIESNTSKGYADYLVKYGTNDCGVLSIPQINSFPFPGFKIYPNPSSDFVIMDNSPVNGRMNLYNTVGQLVATEMITAPTQSINVQSLSPGIYIVELVHPDGKKQHGKLIRK